MKEVSGARSLMDMNNAVTLRPVPVQSVVLLGDVIWKKIEGGNWEESEGDSLNFIRGLEAVPLGTRIPHGQIVYCWEEIEGIKVLCPVVEIDNGGGAERSADISGPREMANLFSQMSESFCANMTNMRDTMSKASKQKILVRRAGKRSRESDSGSSDSDEDKERIILPATTCATC